MKWGQADKKLFCLLTTSPKGKDGTDTILAAKQKKNEIAALIIFKASLL